MFVKISDNINLILKKNKEIDIQVKNKSIVNEEFKQYVEKMKRIYPDFKFNINFFEKYSVEGIAINNLEKLSLHVKQKVKLLVKIVSLDEKLLNTGSYLYKFVLEIPGKRKYINALTFSDNPLHIQKNSFYIADGKIVLGKEQYIKKNELALGKKKDYQFRIDSIIEYKELKDEIKAVNTISRQELHLHTSYSKNDAFITSGDIRKAFLENKIDTVALTDHGTVMSFLSYVSDLKKEFKDQGKKVILGSEFYSVDTEEYLKGVKEKTISFKNQSDFKTRLILEKENQIEELKFELSETRKRKNNQKKIFAKKSTTEEEKNILQIDMDNLDSTIKTLNVNIKIFRNEIKTYKDDIVKLEKDLKILDLDLNNIDNAPRDHLTVLLKTSDSEIDYKGEKLTINLGLVELYKLITLTYTKYFSSPTQKEMKQWGKRPILPYKEIFKEDVRNNFIITSACAFGKHMKLAVEDKWEEFKKWVVNLDAVEIQPIHNNFYMINHEDYKNINSLEDIYNLHKKIYLTCKEVGVPIIFTSDAHVNDKEDRAFRADFKSGYITSIKKKVNDSEENKRKKEAELLGIKYIPSENIASSGDDDFSVDTQPYILTYDEMVEDLLTQGFKMEEIEEIHNNTKTIADKCVNAFDITLLPKKLFLPDFPGVDVKKEVPKLAIEYAIKKWSKDGTLDGIDSKIRERLESELQAIDKTGYEFLYYVARWTCKESEKLGYIVGSRGSVGSMLTAMCLEISENNPLPPHYFCENCKEVEWIDNDMIGIDLPDKKCPKCNHDLIGDGADIEAHNFYGFSGEKISDIDLNFSKNVQNIIHEKVIELLGRENVIKSGTQMFYQDNALKANIFKHIPHIEKRVQNEEFDIEYMANNIIVLNSTGVHPGGCLVKDKEALFEYVTPIVYSSDNNQKGELTSCWVYHDIEEQLPKLDLLGQDDSTMLKELYELTGVDFKKIKLNDKMLYETILSPKNLGIENLSDYPFLATTTGISEMNTSFTMQVLAEIKPKTFTDMVYFSGLTHGTNCYTGNIQRDLIMQGTPLTEVVPVRDIIFQQLSKKYGFDPAISFTISESVRKGKGIKKWENELREKCPQWYVDIMSQISYLFPKAHALSYVTNAMRIYWYKLNYKREFYTCALNRYGVRKNNNKNLDYLDIYSSLTDIDKFHKLTKHMDFSTDNPAKSKDNQRIASIIWEMKLRGLKLEKATLSSEPLNFSMSTKDKNTILMPLMSVKGIGEKASHLISLAYKKYGETLLTMTKDELSQLKVEDNGKEVLAFGKRTLEAL